MLFASTDICKKDNFSKNLTALQRQAKRSLENTLNGDLTKELYRFVSKMYGNPSGASFPESLKAN